jgi:hypothetical protein
MNAVSEREAAVAWLEKDYDQDMTLLTELIPTENGPVQHFWARRIGQWHGPMFHLKDQNG